MTILGLLIICIIAGFGLYMLQLAPLDATVKRIINAVVIVVLIIVVLIFLAGLAGLSTAPLRLR